MHFQAIDQNKGFPLEHHLSIEHAQSFRSLSSNTVIVEEQVMASSIFDLEPAVCWLEKESISCRIGL